jgi:hypothetical protein
LGINDTKDLVVGAVAFILEGKRRCLNNSAPLPSKKHVKDSLRPFFTFDLFILNLNFGEKQVKEKYHFVCSNGSTAIAASPNPFGAH